VRKLDALAKEVFEAVEAVRTAHNDGGWDDTDVDKYCVREDAIETLLGVFGRFKRLRDEPTTAERVQADFEAVIDAIQASSFPTGQQNGGHYSLPLRWPR
jgi:hypothetical protein